MLTLGAVAAFFAGVGIACSVGNMLGSRRTKDPDRRTTNDGMESEVT